MLSSPWGFGIRACIGSQFALWESKLFLAVILRCFRCVGGRQKKNTAGRSLSKSKCRRLKAAQHALQPANVLCWYANRTANRDMPGTVSARLTVRCGCCCRRLVVPEGYVALPSTADGGAAPSPHRLALYVYRRPGRESVLQVGMPSSNKFCDAVHFNPQHSTSFDCLAWGTFANGFCQWAAWP